MLSKYVEKQIRKSFERGRTVIVEGVHIDHHFMKKMLDQYGQLCLPFFVKIEDERVYHKRAQSRDDDPH